MKPPYPLEGIVSWNMNTICNYRCSYCTQRFIDKRTKWAKDLPQFVKAFNRLSGDWELKLSGGEPFRHPQFLEAVEALVKGGRRISVVTNFSSNLETLLRFAEITNPKPGILSASLHLEYVDPIAFRKKLLTFQAEYEGAICVTCVATRSNIPKLQDLKEIFHDISFKIQPEKYDRDVITYTPQEKQLLLAFGGHNSTGAIAPNFQGKYCWAGARYFIVDHLGEAYRCYPARRYKKEYLGNILHPKFRLSWEPALCPYSYCNCTVPQSRGMMSS